MVFGRKCGTARCGISIRNTATQLLTERLFPQRAVRGQRQILSITASLNSRNPALCSCAICGGLGPMTFITHIENSFFAARTFTLTRGHCQLAVALVLVASLFLPIGVMAGELDEQELPPSTQQIALQMPSLESDEHGMQHSLAKSLEYRGLLNAEREAKIQAQTQYLAAKFDQNESAIREYVELAWKEASKRNGMSPELLIAVMQKESSLRPKVQSSYGAQGLMQVVRRWHHDKLHPSESLFDPEVNIRVGADVLAEYLEEADGSLSKALRKYSGNARGYATRVLNESTKLALVAAEAAGQVLASKG